MNNTLHPLHTDIPRPERFTYPFRYEPHPLCVLAAQEVQKELQHMVLTEGKMFGVLVVEAADGTLGFLAAYSGLLEGRNDWPYFVPPVFDAQQPDGHFKQEERRISGMTAEINNTADEEKKEELKVLRRQASEDLQMWLFDQYRMLNAHGERKNLVGIWQDYHCSKRIQRKYPLPPGGTGDCCAPKMLQYAYSKGLKPLCMAEFWWGDSPQATALRTSDGEAGMVRQHGQFYPSCRGKCKPVLTWMLQGLNVDPDPDEEGLKELDYQVIYEDDSIIIIDKPSGLLSVPGRIGKYSAATLMQQRDPNVLLVHRIDMSASGLMVAAKTLEAYHSLQQQFTERTVDKRYIAILDPINGPSTLKPHQKGNIELPLLCDPINRPRQAVDYERGKVAITEYEVLDIRDDGSIYIALYPRTGRTHQLRMHCAHPDGLGCPIHGDELYGRPADRLYLHSQRLELTHPTTGKRVAFELPAPF